MISQIESKIFCKSRSRQAWILLTQLITFKESPKNYNLLHPFSAANMRSNFKLKSSVRLFPPSPIPAIISKEWISVIWRITPPPTYQIMWSTIKESPGGWFIDFQLKYFPLLSDPDMLGKSQSNPACLTRRNSRCTNFLIKHHIISGQPYSPCDQKRENLHHICLFQMTPTFPSIKNSCPCP